MPIAEIAAELVGGVARFIGQMVVEVVLDIAVRGPGYLICHYFNRHADPEGGCAVMVGVLFWLCIALVGYLAYSLLAHELVIDRCLDSGGAFDYQMQTCVHS